MNKELQKLDDMFERGNVLVDHLMVSLMIEEDDDISDKWKMMEIRLLDTKRLAVKWMGEQAEAERSSRLSRASMHSRESQKTTKTEGSREKASEHRRIEILRKQLSKNQERLRDQAEFFEELLKGKDVDMLNREIQVIEKFHENTEAIVNKLKENVSEEERKCLTNYIIEEDAEVLKLKKRFITWIVQQEEADKSSEASVASRKTGLAKVSCAMDRDVNETRRKGELENKMTKLWSKIEISWRPGETKTLVFWWQSNNNVLNLKLR